MSSRCFPFTKLVLALLFAWSLAAVDPVRAQGDGPERDGSQQRASMIFQFLKQTKWPPRKLPGGSVPFVIGIYGPDRVSTYLEEIIAGQTVNGRAVLLKRIVAKEELGTCHLVYISGQDAGHVATALRETRHENVLTVGETANFNASGGVIQFSIDAGRLGYLASLENARRERLTLGGFLLKASGAQVKVEPARKSGSAAANDDEHRTEPARLANAPRP